MKKFGILIFGYFLLFATVPCLAADPGEPDTVWVGSVTAYPTGQAILPIYLFNDEPLAGVSIVLRHNDNFLSIDSFSLIDGLLEEYSNWSFYLNDSADLVSFAAFDFSAAEVIPAGNGLLCNLFFSVDASGAGSVIPIDSTTWFLEGSFKRYTHLTDASATTIRPQFEKGFITILDAPPTYDSVWVDSVGAMAGDQVEIGIYGKNEEDISRIDLTLTFSSDNLSFNDVIFDQSRSQTAQQIEEANQGLRHIHIGLDFGQDTPLPPGRGLLATVIFDIDLSAPDELVVIDSISYLVPQGQSLEFRQTIAAGGKTFAPYFTTGYVDIKSATDIDLESELVLPKEYSLAQNSPNPFNPNTKIQFELPKAGHIRLSVYNVLGQTVRTWFDKQLPAGKHSVIFDARDNNGDDIASGIYFYRLEAGDFSQSKKMILLK